MFNPDFDPYQRIEELTTDNLEITKTMEKLAELTRYQSRVLEVLTVNVRQQALEQSQLRLITQILDHRLQELEKTYETSRNIGKEE